MESPINLCLMKIFTEIPEEIIELAFKKRKTFERDYTLDQMVTTYIIHNRVLKMLNLFGGKIKQIFLLPQYMEKLHRELLDAAAATSPFAIYRIPPEVREDLDIIDVLDVQFISQVNLNLQASPFINHSNSMGSFGHAILDSNTGENMYSTSNVEVLNGNLIRLTPPPYALYNYVVTVRLEHDKEFTNLSNNVIDTLADYAVACTKMFIYNKLIVALDKAYVEAGNEISAVKMIVDTYADAAQRCKELEESLQGSCYLDPQMMQKFLPFIL